VSFCIFIQGTKQNQATRVEQKPITYPLSALELTEHLMREGRLSRRMGLARHFDPVKMEVALVRLIPKEDWTLVSHLLIAYGRKRCMARNKNCTQCKLQKIRPQRGV